MSDEDYTEKLEKHVEDLEELLVANEQALEKALIFARDRNEEIKTLSSFFNQSVEIINLLESCLGFWRDDNLQTQEKFNAVPWDDISMAVKKIPDGESIFNARKHWQEIQDSYTAFEELQKVLKKMNKKLRGRSKEIVDSHLEEVKMKADKNAGRYPVHFDRI